MVTRTGRITSELGQHNRRLSAHDDMSALLGRPLFKKQGCFRLVENGSNAETTVGRRLSERTCESWSQNTRDMQTPVRITFRDMPVSDEVEAKCWHEAQTLARLFDRIIACHVTIAESQTSHRRARLFEVRICLILPDRQLVVKREPSDRHADDDVDAAIRDGFNRMRRELMDYVQEVWGRMGDTTTATIKTLAQCMNAGQGASARRNPGPRTRESWLIGMRWAMLGAAATMAIIVIHAVWRMLTG